MKKFIISLIIVFTVTSLVYAEALEDRFKEIDNLFAQQSYNEALTECKEILKIAPNDTRSYAYLGYAYYKTKNYDQAIESFEKSIELRPDYSYSWHYLIPSLAAKKEYEQAKTKLEEFIRRFPDSQYIPSTKHAFGDIYYRQYKFSLAIDMYTNVIKNHPDYKKMEHVKFWLANAYFNKKEYKNVIELLNEFTNEYPQSKLAKKVHSMLTVAYIREGNIEKSMTELRKSGKFHIVVGVIIGIFLIIILFVVGVYILGRIIRKKKAATIEEISTPIFKIKEVAFINLLTLSLPILVSLGIGKLIYGQYLIGLIPSAKSTESVYTMCIGMITSDILLVSLVLWFIFKKYLLSRKDVGFIFKGWKSITIIPLIMLIIIELFDMAYKFIVMNVLNLSMSEQFLTTVVRSIKTFSQGIIIFIAVVIIAPIVEEIIFRCFFYNAFKKYTNIKWGVFFSSLLFAIYHVQLAYLLPLFFIGVVLTYTYERTKSIIPCMVCHILNNLFFFVLSYFFPNIKI